MHFMSLCWDWCKSIDTSMGPNVHYRRSNIITNLELNECDSNLPQCSGIIANVTVTCLSTLFNYTVLGH